MSPNEMPTKTAKADPLRSDAIFFNDLNCYAAKVESCNNVGSNICYRGMLMTSFDNLCRTIMKLTRLCNTCYKARRNKQVHLPQLIFRLSKCLEYPLTCLNLLCDMEIGRASCRERV